jgi:deferrochelatase/peroxidase EfeB
MTHSFINIIAKLPPENEIKAQEALDNLGNPLKKEVAEIVASINRIHFFSMTVVPGDEDYAPYLVFELSVDGDTESLLETLANKGEEHFKPVFELAKGFDANTPLLSFWKNHLVKTGLGYMDVPGLGHTGTPGMSVERIHKEAALSSAVTEIYNKTDRSGSALDILNRVRETLKKDKNFEWAFTPEPTPLLNGEKKGGLIATVLSAWPGFISTYLWPVITVAAVLSALMLMPLTGTGAGTLLMALVKFLLAGFGIFAGLAVIFIAYVYASLRRLETTDIPDDTPPDHNKMAQIRAREDHAYQNHLAGVSFMKGGKIRQITIRLIFWLIAVLATKLYRPGFLGGIGTIHFARWVMLPDTNRLLFFSNYGGSWESYLEDFITKANFGLTGVWSNTTGFPKTSNLVFDGASDGDRFKRWARRQQNPTWCWYTAYPQLTTARIRINAAIRQGIAGIAVETEARDWLALFASDALLRSELQSDNIQAILFGGFGPLPQAACLTIELPKDTEKARGWLQEIMPKIRFGDERPGTDETAMILPIAASGLRKLGLSDTELAGFPNAFVTGMAARSRILGDIKNSAPAKWLWGGKKTVDAALLIYAPDAGTLEKMVKNEIQALEKAKGKVVYSVPLKELPPKGTPIREPFGFVDGVSQPVIRGIGRHKPGTNDLHILEPGEFIMGYPDGLGTYPQTPTIPAILDPHNDLYAAPDAQEEQRPDFSKSLATAARDLGRDGSYMVIRQLEQDVEGFWTCLEKVAKELGKGPAAIKVSAEWIGAKMVGRWTDGSSLVRNPYKPRTQSKPDARPDNDFLYGKEDAQGMRCPYGSHIRRSNPRESQDPKSASQLAITNRHRILRAGRVYEDGEKKGLLFVCLNGDIERQFEFIQQTWTTNSSFHGLDREIDPLFNTEKNGEYSIPMRDGTRRVKGLQEFITTYGGEYFFLPGRQAMTFLSRTRK